MQIPKHVAIIMDGNGRWAKARGHQRIFGHVRGVRSVRKVVEESVRQDLSFLTLYAFSSENWNRPKLEVNALMKILKKFLLRERNLLIKKNIKFATIGNIQNLPNEIQELIQENIELTKDNTGLQLTLALSYGSRQEITDSVQKIASMLKNNEIQLEDITPELISSNLCTKAIPDPDLIIRTSGESRLSNFMLWQAAYSEIYVTQKNWPDFTVVDFLEALVDFSKRERRFGKTSEQLQPSPGLNL